MTRTPQAAKFIIVFLYCYRLYPKHKPYPYFTSVIRAAPKGVPQGGVLGPELLTLYVKEKSEVVSRTDIICDSWMCLQRDEDNDDLIDEAVSQLL